MKKNYISVPSATNKIQLARNMNVAVYIYGATGFGKTTLVEEFLKNEDVVWLRSSDEVWDLSFLETKNISKENKQVIVFDDLQFLQDEGRQQTILTLAERSDIWTILIGRMSTPMWLIPLLAEGQLMIVKEEQLCITEEELYQYVTKEKIPLSKEDVSRIVQLSFGNAYTISITTQLIKSGEVFNEQFENKLRDVFENHLVNKIIAQWSMEVQEFLMKVSVVDTFPLDLAVMITGDDRAAEIIDEAMRIGNFIDTENNIYYIRPQLLNALRKEALQVFGLSEYRTYMNNAGHYYEIHDDTLNALKMYEKSENTGNIRSVLIRNGRRHFGVGNYYALRRYYLELPESEVEKSPVLMSALCMLYSVLLNVEKSEYWYKKSKLYSAEKNAGEKREADELLLYLDFSIPHRGVVDMIDTITRAASLLKTGGIKLPELSVTGNAPSAMNGGKDFCKWSKRDQFLADTIGKTLEKVLGRTGRGLADAGLCESFYEKGGRDTEVLNHAMLVQMAVEGGGKIEILFVAYGIQIRLSLLTGKKKTAEQLLNAMEERMNYEKNESLRSNYNALKCRAALILGQDDYVDSWLEEAPNEMIDFCILERYRYMTKALCYLSKGENTEAISLLNRMLLYARDYQRIYIEMESLILISIANRREKREWKADFMEALHLIHEYKFVRIISEKGAGVLPLLKEIKSDYLGQKKSDAAWFSAVIKETEQFASRYPNYLSNDVLKPSDFGEISIRVLKMQSEGYSIKEIAEKLDLAERTIKYHASENYRKLNAKGKTDAVQIAKNMNLI